MTSALSGMLQIYMLVVQLAFLYSICSDYFGFYPHALEPGRYTDMMWAATEPANMR
jgi:hypothetical protein